MNDLSFGFMWVLAALGLTNALIAGVFLAFSDFIMRALARARPETGTEVMQIINRVIYRSLFVPMLVIAAPLSVLAGGFGIVAVPGPAGTAAVLAAGIYLVGVMGVTARVNIPMNETLDALMPDERESHPHWQLYLIRWTRWNHVRTGAATLAAAGFLAAALLLTMTS